jgi:glycosyltransferase involved in cell wall biosynthesis
MISFVVPAFNEQDKITETIKTILRATALAGIDDIDIIVVNDGSTDRTGEVLTGLAASLPALRVITHFVNLGVGAAFRDALAVAKADRFVIVPGDNDMSADVLRTLLQFRNSADIVMAFPINNENRTLPRNVLSFFYRMIYMVAFRIFVNYVNAPCVYPTAKLRALNLRSRRFSIIAEATTKLLRTGCSYAEIPGFFQSMQGTRRTVTLRNLSEVMRSFLSLVLDIHVIHRTRYAWVPRRVFIDIAGNGPDGMPLQRVENASPARVAAREPHTAVNNIR